MQAEAGRRSSLKIEAENESARESFVENGENAAPTDSTKSFKKSLQAPEQVPSLATL